MIFCNTLSSYQQHFLGNFFTFFIVSSFVFFCNERLVQEIIHARYKKNPYKILFKTMHIKLNDILLPFVFALPTLSSWMISFHILAIWEVLWSETNLEKSNSLFFSLIKSIICGRKFTSKIITPFNGSVIDMNALNTTWSSLSRRTMVVTTLKKE